MFRYEIENYKPFEDIKNFYIMKDKKEDYKLLLHHSDNNSYILRIKKDGYIPKSGLIFKDIIEQKVNNKEVLDLGTGQLGFLAIHSLMSGARKVEAVDIDEECVEWLNYLISENNLSNITVKKSDFFKEIEQDKKYDIILSNPPQMPAIEGLKHDEGGVDGRKYILEILKNSKKHLNENGELFILVFDYLGTDKRTNENESIFEIATKLGYKNIEIIKRTKKTVKEGSITSKNLEHIKNTYPIYKFNTEGDSPYHYIEILKFN